MAYIARHKELNLLNSESQRILRELIENIPMGVFMADGVNNLFYVNDAFNEIFDFPNRAHALGQNWESILLPEDKLKETFLIKLRTLGLVNDFQVTRRNNLGHTISFIISARYIRAQEGEIIGIQGVVLDISQRRWLEDQTRLEREKLEQILGFYNSLAEITDFNELCNSIILQTVQLLNVKRASLMLIDPKTNDLSIKAAFGINEETITTTRIKLGESVAGRIALRNDALLINDIEHNDLYERPNRASYSNPSFMGAPIIYDGHPIGIINVAEKEQRFTALDLKLLQTIAQQSSININKVLTVNTLEHLSQTDPMTGLFNFRSFNQKLDDEINRSARYGLPLSIMMIDIDNFKKYNDSHGHPAGNQLLKRLSDIFRGNLRASEWICRWGGDEFGIILPNTDAPQAFAAAEKLRQLAQNEFLKDNVSLSIGVAQFQPKSNKEDFIAKSDEALYFAKSSGRNRVVTA